MEENVRELSMSELELVSGGYNTDHYEPPYDLGDIGPVTPGGGGGGGGWDWGDWGDWGDYGDGGGGSGDGGIPMPPPPQTPCELDAAKDSVAKSIESAIKAMPDWNEREYGALILRNSDGYIYIGDIARGETVAEAKARAAAAGEENFAPETRFGSVPAGFTVVGVVHSHPNEGYNNAEDIENRYPSDYAGGGDYYNFEQLVGKDPRFSSAAEFTQYILGPDGTLREFSFTEGRVTHSNDTKAAERSDLASNRPCEG